ncbi:MULTISPECIES: hypothetical protein [unclassified Duganella]|uniref:hypothetical protein n=1 Tax=unclassified Duganella TaxID=2636909 RepID=UPI000E35161F|nr:MULTISPECIES: hypothetical protein [unclassified Duganella]RFP10078.1 hypothetical protein D0T23_24105 [Duganella sp. BJB475]RFP25616.1 hypothetical protein D0T21_26505 [Duganella sp. BJB476]
MLISLAQFRSLVDQTKPQLSNDTPPEVAKAFVGLQHEFYYQRRRVGDMLLKQVKASFTSGHRNVFSHCSKLLRELIHDHEANDAVRDPYFEILKTMQDTIRGAEYDPQVEGDWTAAVQAAVNYVEWNGLTYLSLYEQLHAAEIHQARTKRKIKSARKAGRTGNTDQVLGDQQKRAIARTIEMNFVKHMGAGYVAEQVFSLLATKFDTLQQRYHEVNQFSPGPQQNPPRLPIGLLLNYAAKYALPKRPLRKNQADWKNLLNISIDFATAYDVRPTSNLDSIHVDQRGMLPFLRRLAIYDAMFTLQQTRPTDIVRIICGLISGLRKAKKFPAHLDPDVRELLQVIEALQTVIANRSGPVRIESKDVAKVCTAIAESRVSELLQDVFAHPAETSNKNFTIPDEVPDDSLPRDERAGPNFGDRPLLTLQRDQYLLLDHSVNAPAMIEAVLTRLRQVGLDGDIGYGIEGLLHDELTSKSFATQTGKYRAGGKTWECDVVLETDTQIFFIETKKKSLTRSARSGFDVALLVDITDSIVSATIQGLRHELQIKQNSFIELTQEDDSIVRIELRDRKVECIAVTLPDYGSFQDRIVLHKILENGMKLSFSTEDRDLQKKLDKVNKKLDELRAITKDLYQQANQPERWKPYSHCWFLSVPQFLILLDDVSSPEDFANALNLIRNKSTGTNDFYFDLYCAKQRLTMFNGM